MTYFIQIYGCQMNYSDGERIASLFNSLGYIPAQNLENAGLYVVITCSVRQMAADRVFGLENKINPLRQKNPRLKTILTGCVVKNDIPRFSKIFDHILNINDLSKWPKIIGLNGPACSGNDYFSIPPAYTKQFSVSVPISQGCDNYCSYCVVPYTRGPLICRNYEEIANEVKNAVGLGAKEIWLLGQNVNNYHYGKVDFADLLKMINEIPGDFWVRFTSPHPKDFNDKAVDAMAQCAKVAPYLNLPAQSGDDKVLRAMKRPYTAAHYKKLVSKLRKAFKKYRTGLESKLALSTDIIVGFPGETKQQFQNSAKLFKSVKYDMAYIAQYSPRAGTAAYLLENNITAREKTSRHKVLNDILKKTALQNNKIYKNKIVTALVDSIFRKTIRGKKKVFAYGKTRSYKTVEFEIDIQDPQKIIGSFVNVKITKIRDFCLTGRMN